MISVEGGGGVGQLGEKKGMLGALVLVAGLAVLLILTEIESLQKNMGPSIFQIAGRDELGAWQL